MHFQLSCVGPTLCVLVRQTLTSTQIEHARADKTTGTPALMMWWHGTVFNMLSWHFRHHMTQ